MTASPTSSHVRRALLDRQLQMLVVQGRRIESHSDFHAVLVRGHGILERREIVSVDVSGVSLVEQLSIETERILIAVSGAIVIAIVIAIGLIFG